MTLNPPQWLRFRPILWGLASLLVGLAIGNVFGSRSSYSDDDQRRLRETSLLLVQQVDRLAASYFDSLPSGSLPERDREALRLWRLYDKQFVELNRPDKLKSFEVATALRRIGFASLLLGDQTQARDFLDQANQLFTDLESEYPMALSYRIDHAATRLQLAQLDQLENKKQSAITECQAAVNILQIEQTLQNGEYDLAVAKLVHSAARMFRSLGDRQAAEQLSSQNVTLLEQLDEEPAQASVKAKMLDESRNMIQSTNHDS